MKRKFIYKKQMESSKLMIFSLTTVLLFVFFPDVVDKILKFLAYCNTNSICDSN